MKKKFVIPVLGAFAIVSSLINLPKEDSSYVFVDSDNIAYATTSCICVPSINSICSYGGSVMLSYRLSCGNSDLIFDTE